MKSIHVLANEARRLNRGAGGPLLPALIFMTDPLRTPDPMAIARRLPAGACVIYRHFGAPERGRVARRLAALCRARRLILLISADPALAARVGAAGVHWPEQRLPRARPEGGGLQSAAAHSAEALARAAAFGADFCVLGPVFSTRSASGNSPLGLFHASQLARAAPIPAIALGGVNALNAMRLRGRGFAGLAAIDGLS